MPCRCLPGLMLRIRADTWARLLFLPPSRWLTDVRHRLSSPTTWNPQIGSSAPTTPRLHVKQPSSFVSTLHATRWDVHVAPVAVVVPRGSTSFCLETSCGSPVRAQGAFLCRHRSNVHVVSYLSPSPCAAWIHARRGILYDPCTSTAFSSPFLPILFPPLSLQAQRTSFSSPRLFLVWREGEPGGVNSCTFVFHLNVIRVGWESDRRTC